MHPSHPTTRDVAFLRRVLLADAAVSALTGVLLLAGAGLAAPLTGLPPELLRWSGLSLLPFAGIVAAIALRPLPPRPAVWAVIACNALWTIDSIALPMTGWIAPNTLGVVAVVTQAVAVAAFAELEYLGLRRTGHQRA